MVCKDEMTGHSRYWIKLDVYFQNSQKILRKYEVVSGRRQVEGGSQGKIRLHEGESL